MNHRLIVHVIQQEIVIDFVVNSSEWKSVIMFTGDRDLVQLVDKSTNNNTHTILFSPAHKKLYTYQGFSEWMDSQTEEEQSGEGGSKKKHKAIKYYIDCTHPVEDGIFDLNAFVLFLAVILGGLIWGIPGMVLFVPYAGIIKAILESNENTRPLVALFTTLPKGALTSTKPPERESEN